MQVITCISWIVAFIMCIVSLPYMMQVCLSRSSVLLCCLCAAECSACDVGRWEIHDACHCSDVAWNNLLCVDRRMNIHGYVLCKTDKCGRVTQPCTLHSNAVCVWDYRCRHNLVRRDPDYVGPLDLHPEVGQIGSLSWSMAMAQTGNSSYPDRYMRYENWQLGLIFGPTRQKKSRESKTNLSIA